MTDSHLDSDRLLAIAHGLARWSPEEAAHLERCAECRLEWKLVQAAGGLGRAAAERVSPARAAVLVADRLRTAPAPGVGVPRPRARWILAIAAAATIALAVLLPGGGNPSEAVPATAELAVLHELDGLTPAELEAVLEILPPTADEALHVDAAPIGELTAQDLERMLQSME